MARLMRRCTRGVIVLVLVSAVELVGTATVDAQAPELTCWGWLPTILGTSGDDEIHGTQGDDVILGFGGNDTIYGDGGTDYVCAGTGDDSVVDETSHPGFAMLGPGADTSMDSNHVIGGGGDDRLTAPTYRRATLRGGRGDDTILGSDSDPQNTGLFPDQLFGGDGQDQITARGPLNYIHPGSGRDTVDVTYDKQSSAHLFYDDAQGVRVDLAAGKAWGHGMDNLVGNITWVTGSPSADVLEGGNGREVLQGEGGNDQLAGGGGPDLLRGGDGTDAGDGGPGDDMCRAIEKRTSC